MTPSSGLNSENSGIMLPIPDYMAPVPYDLSLDTSPFRRCSVRQAVGAIRHVLAFREMDEPPVH